MPQIMIETMIQAPPEVVFDLVRQAGGTGEQVRVGQTVTFEGRHFGIDQRLTVRVVKCDPPRSFIDEMIEGTFKAFRHSHEFHDHEGKTRMVDILEWTSGYGFLGRFVDQFLLKRHLRGLVLKRNERLKQLAGTNLPGAG
jgi:ligand-binding SRPBCC domain-containing protein